MGKDAKDFFNRIYSSNQNTTYVTPTESITVSGFDNLVKELADDTKINETLLKGAIYLEIAEQTKLNEAFEKVFSLNNQLADWLRGGIEAIEKWKFTEENYDYIKYYVNPMYSTYQNKIGTSGFLKQEVKYKPIIPVPIAAQEYKTMQNASEITAAGFSRFKEFANYFEEVSLAIVTTVVKATPTITDDIFLAVVFYLKNFIEDNIPESIKNVYNKLKVFFNEILEVFSGIGAIIVEKVDREVAKINAFLCGLLNGLISLAQTVIMLLAMVTDKIPFLEMEKMSPLELAKHQEKLEFIEDFVDLFAQNSKEFLIGVKNLFSDGKIWKELSKVVDGLKKKFSDLNEYFWAYFIGAVAFELILDAIIAYFTGGSSLVAQASAKIGRITAKAEQLGSKGIQFSQNLGRKIANSLQDLYKWLEKEFLEMLEAIKSGKIGEWIKKKIDAIFGEGNKPYDEIFEGLRDYLRIISEHISYQKCLELVKKNRVFEEWMEIELEAMIKYYTSNLYTMLNKALRSENITEEIGAMKMLLDAALEKLPPSIYNKGLLQRTAKFTEEEIQKLFVVGQDFVEKGFLSTTYSEDVLHGWLASNNSHNVIFKIVGKNGKLIEDASFLPAECEVLFKSETTFKVESVYMDKHPIIEGKYIKIIKLIEK
ncbi:hypothetical protein BOQ62_03830 [Chryseobacterium sp. CH21]|uniref:ADP-ribosyltransferase n=1 Tax=Chryseobacterium sp. CH21 TaxID=713556 RepID=UPI00100A321D|nr:ADP-ribosyltransferase [Chryseobacterium sp. CH21]RXM40857.1 hypothetical protein BOQ62_03830 [Chryseobacterium sp. CH21]